MASYFAFLSYSRADRKIALWLQRVLEAYRTSKRLVDVQGRPARRRLRPIFRDQTDLGTGGELTDAIRGALHDSEALIVLCSPHAASSRWVNLEVEAFLALERRDQIFPVILSGEPDSVDPELECLPPALRGLNLIAADLRSIKQPDGRMIGDGRTNGRLKLIAGLLGVTLDALIRREHQRRRRSIAMSLCGAAVLIALALMALVFWARADVNRREAARQAASVQLAESRFVTSALTNRNGWPDTRVSTVALLAVLPRDMRKPERPLLNDAVGLLSEWIISDAIGPIIPQSRKALVVRWRPDGKAFLTTWVGLNGVQVWDAQSGDEIATLSIPGNAMVSAEWSSDGRTILTEAQGPQPEAIQRWDIWDTASWAIAHRLPAHTREDLPPEYLPHATDGCSGRCRVVSWDGKSIALFSRDQGTYVTDVVSGAMKQIADAAKQVQSLQWSLDGTRILVALTDYTVRVWDSGTGAEILKFGVPELLNAMWNPDESKILTASGDRVPRLWYTNMGVADGALNYRNEGLNIQSDYVGGAPSWSGTGKIIYGVMTPFRTAIWDAYSRELIGSVPSELDYIPASRLINPAGPGFTTGALAGGDRHGPDDGGLMIWEPDRPFPPPLGSLDGNPDLVEDLDWHPSALRLASAGRDGTVWVWDATSKHALRVLDGAHGAVRTVRWSPDGGLIAYGTEDGTTLIQSVTDGNLRQIWLNPGETVRALDWSPDGGRVATALQAGSVQIRSIADGGLVARCQVGAWANAIAWSPDGRRIAVGEGSGALTFCDPATGVATAVEGPKMSTGGFLQSMDPLLSMSLAWSKVGDRLAVVDSTDHARILSATGQLEGEFEAWGGDNRGTVRSVAWSHDGTRLAGVVPNRGVFVWDVATRIPVAIVQPMTEFTSVRWSADDTMLALSPAIDSHAVWLWDARPLVGAADLVDTERLRQWVPLTKELETSLFHGSHEAARRVAMRGIDACDQLAANPYDEGRKAPGTSLFDLETIPNRAKQAASACADAVAQHPREARFHYQLGRSWTALGENEKALDEYGQALKGGYTMALIGISYHYKLGFGVPADLEKAGELKREAAFRGVRIAQSELAQAALYSSSGPEATKAARSAVVALANAGDADANRALGLFAFLRTERDLREAVYRLALAERLFGEAGLESSAEQAALLKAAAARRLRRDELIGIWPQIRDWAPGH
jgi:WD40 repeat protein